MEDTEDMKRAMGWMRLLDKLGNPSGLDDKTAWELMQKINEYGHQFTSFSRRARCYNRYDSGSRDFIALGLHFQSAAETMLIEKEDHISARDVNSVLKQIERLKEFGHCEDKKYLAAVAGLTIEKEAREKASELGMYVIEVFEDEGRINIIKPDGELGSGERV